MAGPAHDPAADPNEPDTPLDFPLHSVHDEADASGSLPDAVSAGARGQTTERLAWLATLLAVVGVGSAVAFLTDDGGAPALTANSTAGAAADDLTDDAAPGSTQAATDQVQPRLSPSRKPGPSQPTQNLMRPTAPN